MNWFIARHVAVDSPSGFQNAPKYNCSGSVSCGAIPTDSSFAIILWCIKEKLQCFFKYVYIIYSTVYMQGIKSYN